MHCLHCITIIPMSECFIVLRSRYENTAKSSLYTYEVDLCFMGALAAKLGFPWIYEYITGNSCE